MKRRKFIQIAGASAASFSIPGALALGRAADQTFELGREGWRLGVSPQGEIVSFTDGRLELVNRRLGDNRPRVVVGRYDEYACERPAEARRTSTGLLFLYRFAGRHNFSVEYELALTGAGPNLAALRQRVAIEAQAKIAESVRLIVPCTIQLPFKNRQVFLPLKNGIGRRKAIQGLENADEYAYDAAGAYKSLGKPQPLAVPLVDESADASPLRLAHATDPFFSSYFYLPYAETAGEFNCIYSGQVGVQKEERTVYTAPHRAGAKGAMEAFYQTALAAVKPGPDWLHDVAMVDFDYLSKNGRGWFRDIDALEKLIAPRDRGKVFLAMHGWYDLVGQYAFDWRQGAFLKQWTAFPSARLPRVQRLGDGPKSSNGYVWKKQPVAAMRPVPMSLKDMHRRIRYAKDKGFRVGIYYADGTNSCEGATLTYDPSKVLHWGGWQGPDTRGKSFAQNPLHPQVREFYLKYIQGLLEEYGKEVDGFIWDETFVVRPKDLGPAAAPGYASRGMMTLVQQVAAEVARSSPELALLASDDTGLSRRFEENVPYALAAHGTYQDSGCNPVAWPYGLFPNFRNVLWSCNWAPVTRLRYSRYGVETFDVPAPISNGPFGDDIGIGDMSPDQQKNTMDLFNQRKDKPMEIGWIDEGPWQPKYQGRAVGFKWDL